MLQELARLVDKEVKQRQPGDLKSLLQGEAACKRCLTKCTRKGTRRRGTPASLLKARGMLVRLKSKGMLVLQVLRRAWQKNSWALMRNRVTQKLTQESP